MTDDPVTVLRRALPPGLTIRALTTDDVDLYLDLTRRASDFYETYDGGLPSREALAADMVDHPSTVADEAKFRLGVFRGDVLVVYVDVLAGYPDERTWFIGLLLIAESERRQGLGRAIVGALGRAALVHRAWRLMIGVFDANTPARRFWRWLGFRDEKHLPDYTNAAGQLQPVTRMERPLFLA